jgi:Flp pilus assembly protein TadG
MLPLLFPRRPRSLDPRSRERGFTMALVAVAMVAMIGMAALSIDLGTLYQAKAEAQRAADAAALSAARVISFSGITGDPTNASGSWPAICGGVASPATLIAVNTAQQNLIAGAAAGIVNVYYGTNAGPAVNTNCSSVATDFGVNPIVTVTVQRANLPIFFAKVFSLFPGVNYSGTGVSASATAEAFNPSDSGKGAPVAVPVQPRCVKPWIIPNQDPDNPNGGGVARPFVNLGNGGIVNAGILQLSGGVIGETFNLQADCVLGATTSCTLLPGHNPPTSTTTVPQYADYIPALVSGTPAAVPSCSTTNTFQKAIGGCDQNTVYTCGVPSTTAGATQADLTENPNGGTGDTSTATQCLINQTVGQDSLMGSPPPPPLFPFRIVAGAGNPLIAAGASSGEVITVSNSMVTIPIADFSGPALAGTQPAVSIVGFLQVFVNYVDTGTGNVNVTVINVSGCGNGATGNPVYGTSPVPVRLITPPS